ncbi:hypothetical protein ACNTMW_33695 [Planosporangium sp. 12N6]|uniref:hypothetical protein n=1 Tax=Planosporangium spinosum TaxID=3402278 RepID=UPI003CEB369F
MADIDDDVLITGAFASFRNEATPHVKPAGVAAAQETVRHRRRVRTIAATTLAALVVAGPAVAYAAINADPHGPPSQVATSQSPTPEPSTSAAPAPSASAGPSSPPAAPDGRISEQELKHATLDLPAWPSDEFNRGCVSGPTTFTDDGRHYIKASMHLWIGKVAYADVDHDGATETIVVITCGDQGSTYQVVALDRDADGTIRTIGQVVAATGAIRTVFGVKSGPDGTVQVEVGDYPIPLGGTYEPDKPLSQHQWRTYGWNGSRFTQVGGPTSFPVNPKVTDLATTTTDLVFGAPVDGVHRGSMTVTVRNLGPTALPYRVVVEVPAGLQLVAPTGCTVETFAQPVMNVTCDQGALAAGATKTVTFEFTTPTPVTPNFLPRASVRYADGYGDSNWANNEAQFTVKY